MSDDPNSTQTAPELPQAAVGGKRRFSLVWLIPIVAAIAGAWLVYTTFAERGPTITITFQFASGIEPGKTPIKYRDVQLGLVESVTLSDDLQHVLVTARMERAAEHELREETQFWIESARITAGGVSGLGTLLSGAYIGIRPGPGKPSRHFVALETPPVYQVDVPGKRLTLRAEKLGSVSPGSPIYFRGIEVGGVLGYHLDENGKDVSIFAFVRAPYDAFVRRDSRFWNASGIDVSLTGAGVNVRTESLQAILVGGIAFDTPVRGSASPVAEDNATFPLFASYDAIQQDGSVQSGVSDAQSLVSADQGKGPRSSSFRKRLCCRRWRSLSRPAPTHERSACSPSRERFSKRRLRSSIAHWLCGGGGSGVLPRTRRRSPFPTA